MASSNPISSMFIPSSPSLEKSKFSQDSSGENTETASSSFSDAMHKLSGNDKIQRAPSSSNKSTGNVQDVEQSDEASLLSVSENNILGVMPIQDVLMESLEELEGDSVDEVLPMQDENLIAEPVFLLGSNEAFVKLPFAVKLINADGVPQYEPAFSSFVEAENATDTLVGNGLVLGEFDPLRSIGVVSPKQSTIASSVVMQTPSANLEVELGVDIKGLFQESKNSSLLTVQEGGVTKELGKFEQVGSFSQLMSGALSDKRILGALSDKRILGALKGDVEFIPSLSSTVSSEAASIQRQGLVGPSLSSDLGRVTIPVNITFGHSQWSSAMAEKTAWAISQNIQTADIQLDPPELGPIQVKIHVHQDQASVSFVSANPAVREAIDQSLSRLKELLEEQGVQLLDSGVSEHSHQQSDSEDGGSTELGQRIAEEEISSSDHLRSVQIQASTGIDYFA